MKLWQKGEEVKESIEAYTVGGDYLLDQLLVVYDCQASLAHAKMLQATDLISEQELEALDKGLNQIVELHSEGKFAILPQHEDCHTAIENYLVENFGDVGKKIHTARSRNDQVLTAVRLYQKDMLETINDDILALIDSISDLKKRQGDIEMPGYTHMQPAMPSSVAMWCDSMIDALDDDLLIIEGLYDLIDQSPLGTAAGFGVPVLDIKRELTAKELGFARVQESPIYAQHSRGKFDGQVINFCSSVMLDLNKMASDLILFNMREFGLVKLPPALCTGSSIMPQKKNPDVLELMRAKYHEVLGEEFKVKGIISNLISGYNRDYQLTKGPMFNSVEITQQSVVIAKEVISSIVFDQERAAQLMGKELYATQEAYQLVKEGVPFREAYLRVGQQFVAKK